MQQEKYCTIINRALVLCTIVIQSKHSNHYTKSPKFQWNEVSISTMLYFISGSLKQGNIQDRLYRIGIQDANKPLRGSLHNILCWKQGMYKKTCATTLLYIEIYCYKRANIFLHVYFTSCAIPKISITVHEQNVTKAKP